jgi:hypothetical protein
MMNNSKKGGSDTGDGGHSKGVDIKNLNDIGKGVYIKNLNLSLKV